MRSGLRSLRLETVEVKQPSEVEQEEEEEDCRGAQQDREAVCAAGRDLSGFAMFELCPLYKRLLQKRRRNNSFV